MPALTVLKMSPQVRQTMGLIGLERRRDRLSNSSRRPRRNRSFRNRSVRVDCRTNRESRSVQDGQGSSSTSLGGSSMGSNENIMVSVHNHGEKVRCLIKMLGQQRQLYEEVYMSPIMQLQARRVRSLFALAQHFDSKSTATKLGASQESTSEKEPEERQANQIVAEFSQMALSS